MYLGRLFQDSPLTTGQSLSLDERGSHYIGTVLRGRVGDTLTLFNGLGGDYPTTLTLIAKKHCVVEIGEWHNQEIESPLKITLAQGIARGERMDVIVQKAVELGVFDVMPLLTERCNVRLSGEREEKRLLHWQQVAISACEQSGRNQVPMIHAPEPYSSWVSSCHNEYGFVLSPHVQNHLSEMKVPSSSRVCVVIGPEGGLTEEEVLQAVNKGFKPLSLGPRILRTETATLAALTAMQLYFGDLG